jgi:signal transduction histidine kinase
MSESERRSRAEIEQAVADEFQAAGYEVSQRVGAQPGEVDWFARPRTGLERSTTYWQVWDACPEAFHAALGALEEARKAKAADRAFAVMDDAVPEGYSADLRGKPSNVITLNRLVFELNGLADRVREQKLRYEAQGEPGEFLPRKGIAPSGEIVDAVAYVKAWLRHGPGKNLAISGRQNSGRSSLIARVAYELSVEFESDPETVIPLVLHNARSRRDAMAADLRGIGARNVRAVDLNGDDPKDPSLFIDCVLKLLDPSDADIENWFKDRLVEPDGIKYFRSARDSVPEFKTLSNDVPNLIPLLDAIRTSPVEPSRDAKEWAVGVISSYIEAQMSRPYAEMHVAARLAAGPGFSRDFASTLEDAAFQQFALGDATALRAIADAPIGKSLGAILATWLALPATTFVALAGKPRIAGFVNNLVRDYFVARKIVREITSGNSAILARHQFPKDYVLLFLATLSPSAAAQATAERSAEIRAEIEAEVERRLQLTLAHLLKRSVGAIRLNIGLIQDGISPADAASFQQEFSRIDEELSLQSALAEQTGRWQEVPNGTPQGLALGEIVGAAVGPIRQKYPAVVCDIVIPASLRVQASLVGLREILHCLIENAFHAVAFVTDPEPHISILAVTEGDTIRLEIIDNGPGIRPEDRERIFDPYVTTKKDVGRPFGTGLGLAIARRYAAKIGAQVALDADRPETCFVVRFVTWREPS